MSARAAPADLQFNQVVDDFVFGTLALSPVTASTVGYHKHHGEMLEDQLDDFSAASSAWAVALRPAGSAAMLFRRVSASISPTMPASCARRYCSTWERRSAAELGDARKIAAAQAMRMKSGIIWLFPLDARGCLKYLNKLKAQDEAFGTDQGEG